MIFSRQGEVAKDFHVLGRPEYPIYLLDGERPVLFDGGLSHLGGTYASQAKAILGNRKPQFLFHTHLHYDHCGSSSFLRKCFPGLKIAASIQGAEIMARPRAVELMQAMNDAARMADAGHEPVSAAEESFEPFTVDVLLADGNRVDLGGGRSLVVYATPGHTRDFLSYYIPEAKILIASEAVGCAHAPGNVFVQFVSDYDQYLASLERLVALDVEVLCQGHFYVFTGKDVKDFLDSSVKATTDYRKLIETLIAQEGGDAARIVRRVKEIEWDVLTDPKLPETAYLLNTEARVKHLISRGERQKTVKMQSDF